MATNRCMSPRIASRKRRTGFELGSCGARSPDASKGGANQKRLVYILLDDVQLRTVFVVVVVLGTRRRIGLECPEGQLTN